MASVTTRVTMRAQAKLNLWLHVMAREESGYHSIETLFHRIDLADDVAITLAPFGERSITCSEDVGPPHANLAYRAAQMYCGASDWPTGFHIDIVKRIPAGGGLGGGSADAAATLLALNAIAPRARPENELLELAHELGADVPFMTTGALKALAWGHGDRMLKLPPLPERHVALLVPGFQISTPDVYQSLAGGGGWPPEQLSVTDLTDWSRIAKQARNDLARSLTIRRQPKLGECIGALRAAGALMAEMSGSGSVLFGIFESAPDPDALAAVTGCRVLLTRTATDVEAPRLIE